MTRASGPVVVIGGGHNGLTAAIFLAKAGHRVVVVEAEPTLGGLARRHEFHPGYAVPGLLHDSARVDRETVAELGLARAGLKFRKPPDIWVPEARAGEIAGDRGLWLRGNRVEDRGGALAAGDDERYRAVRGYLARIGIVLGRIMRMPPPDIKGPLWSLIKTGWNVRKLDPPDLIELLRGAPMPVADWLTDHFHGETLRAALALDALSGAYMAPRSPGSAGNLFLRACVAGDEIAGGPSALIDALAECASAHGVEIRTDAPVRRIALNRQATAIEGVELDDGEVIATSRVLASCDPKTVFLQLIGPRYLPSDLARHIGNIRTRAIVARLHLALSGPLKNGAGESVEAMRIAGSLDDIERAFDGVKYGHFAERPALDIRVSSMGDPGLSPPGHHTVSISVYAVPRELSGGWTDDARDRLHEAVIARMAEHVQGVRDLIVGSELLTPGDIEARFRVTDGHMYHGEHALDQLLFMRPTLSCAGYATPISGLFSCGSGSHPGGGLTCSPGRLASQAFLASEPG